MMLMLMMTTIE